MVCRHLDLEEIVLKSQSLFQNRRSNDFIADLDPVLLKRWCDAIAKGDERVFRKRLHWEQQELALDDNASPWMDFSWTEIFTEYLDEVCSKATHPDYLQKLGAEQRSICSSPLPFVEFFLPFVYITRNKFQINHLCHITEGACKEIEEYLLQSLVGIASQCFQLEFSIFRARRTNRMQCTSAEGQKSTQLYCLFIDLFYKGWFADFFKEYAVAARLLSVKCKQHMESFQEFLSRLHQDMHKIRDFFSNGMEMGKVKEISTGLSDQHHHGRTVIILTFESGLKLVYKPKNSRIEYVYNQFLNWLNEHGSPNAFKTFKVLDQEEYAWVEYVAAISPRSMEDARKYFTQSGALLFLSYGLNGIDMHHENIVQHGEYPVLIDLETLLHPDVTEHWMEKDMNVKNAIQKFCNSVVGIGLLPSWQFDVNGKYDSSGFAAKNSTLKIKTFWYDINSDNMRYNTNSDFEYESGVDEKKNAYAVGDFIQEIAEGFSKMYHFFLEKKEEFLHNNGPLSHFNHTTVRYVFRRTQTYFLVKQKAFNPKYMRDGAERSMQLDMLSIDLLEHNKKPLSWPILACERAALENLDIPSFYVNTGSRDFSPAPDVTIYNYFKESGFEALLNKIKFLSEEDLEFQLDLIKGSVFAYHTFNIHTSHQQGSMNSKMMEIDPLTKNELLQEALSLGQKLKKRAIANEENQVTWISHQYDFHKRCYRQQPLGYNFYDGFSGIALFLAALGHVTGEEEYTELSLNCLKWLENSVEESFAHELEHHPMPLF